MSDRSKVNRGRPQTWSWWALAQAGAAAVGTAVPLVASMLPSERAEALGAPVEADIGQLAPGEKMTVEWRGNPFGSFTDQGNARRDQGNDGRVAGPQERTKKSELTPEYAGTSIRSIRPEYLVVVGICTHLGCPAGQA